MRSPLAQGELYLNGKNVGRVTLRGSNHSWSYGEFAPGDSFVEFAPLFGRWSLLIHADGDACLSAEASEELRSAECALDRLHAKLFLPERQEWRDLAQVNIDGTLIEWKTR
jgi:hypothetical protein